MMRALAGSVVLAAILASAASGATTARPALFRGTGTIVFSCAGCPLSPSRGELYTVSASGRNLRRVPTGPQSPASPSWSPTGRFVAFSAGSSIWRLKVSPRGSSKRLTRHCDLCDRDPAWSPDGRHVVFVRDGSLYTVRTALGAQPRMLRRGSFESPDWSPDGHRIAFHDSAARLYVMRRDGTEVTRVGRAERGRLPRWSPNGKLVAFIGPSGRAHAVKVIRPNGTGLRVVARPQSLASGVNPAWSPDGRHVLFVVAHEFGQGQSGRELQVVSLASRTVRRIAMPRLPRTVFADINGVDWKR